MSEPELDYSDYVDIRIIKVKYMGEPSHWQVDMDDELGGTSPNFAGAVDIAMEIICGEYGEEEWHQFDANKQRNEMPVQNINTHHYCTACGYRIIGKHEVLNNFRMKRHMRIKHNVRKVSKTVID